MELENHANILSKSNVYDNTIIDCFSAVTVTGKANRHRIYDNLMLNARFGTWITGVSGMTLIEAYDNHMNGVVYGGLVQGSDTSNIHWHSNVADGSPLENFYRKPTPDAFVWSVESPTTFLSAFSYDVGGTYYIDGVAVTIVSNVNSGVYVRNDSSTDELYLVTITDAVLTSDMKFKFARLKIDVGAFGTAGFSTETPIKKARVYKNHLTNFDKPILVSGASTDSTYLEQYFNNTIGSCNFPIYVADSGGTTRKFRENTSLYDNPKFYNGVAKLGCVALKIIERFDIGAATTSSYPSVSAISGSPSLPFYIVRVVLFGTNMSGATELTLTIQDTVTSASTTYSATASNVNGQLYAEFSPNFGTSSAGNSNLAFVVKSPDPNLTYTGGKIWTLTD